MLSLTFYTTQGCHLCEQAWLIINQVHVANLQVAPLVNVNFLDIADSDDLIEAYGTRIPVLEAAGIAELNWPFDHQQYVDFLDTVLKS